MKKITSENKPGGDGNGELNPAQKEAVHWHEGPLVIIAGAGTGKTTVITERIAWLLQEKKIPSDHVLALTFTEKAAEEMEERVEKLLEYGYHDLWISTFHAFCQRILEDNALEIGLPHQFRLLTETEQWVLLRQNLDRLQLDYYRPLGNPTKFLQAIIKHFSRLKDENITPQQYLDYAQDLQINSETVEMPQTKRHGKNTEEKKFLDEAFRAAELARAYHEYQKILLEEQALDFGDLILYTLKLFQERPSLLDKYRKQFEYILVDEFQDTNHAQYELVKLLAEPRRNITVCLDDDQSIYKFRGASVSNVLEFKRDYPQAKDVVLTENYRSPQNILDLAYNFIQQNNPDRLEFQLKEKTTVDGTFSAPISKKLHSQQQQPGEIQHIAASSAGEEARLVIEKIAEMKQRSNATWNDFAILIRANDQADQFIPFFERTEIPYQFLASRGLYRKPEIMDLISYLKMLDNYHESRSLYRVLTMEMFALAALDLMNMLNFASKKSISLYEALTVAATIPGIQPATIKTIEKILGLIQKHTELARRKPVSQVLLAFLQDSGYLQHINTKPEAVVLEKTHLITQFYKEIEKFEKATNEPTIKNFIYELELAQEAGESGSLQFDPESGPEAVKIMTIHAAKGLEFDHVFVVNMVDKRFPSIHRRDPILIPEALIKETLPSGDAHLQEERRLFYVACTRARRSLFFTSAKDYGGTREKKPSLFLYETGLIQEPVEKPKKQPTGKVLLADMNPISKNPAPVPEKFPYSLPKKFSFTQIMAFETCPYQYRFAHILRLPTKGRANFSFGKTMHDTLYQAFRKLHESTGKQVQLFTSKTPEKESAITLPDLLEIYKKSWIDDWYPNRIQKEKYYQKGKEILEEFHHINNDGRFPKTLDLEKPFNLRLGQYVIKGVIDRLDPGDEPGTVHILDYKTGTVPKKEPEAEKWRQLYLYALACQDVFALKPLTVTFYYLEANKPVTRSITEKDLQKCRAEVEETIRALLASDFHAVPGRHCAFCDFRDICQYKKI